MSVDEKYKTKGIITMNEQWIAMKTPASMESEIKEVCELLKNSGETSLIEKSGSLKSLYSVYEITKDPLVLERIVIELIEAIKELINTSSLVSVSSSPLTSPLSKKMTMRDILQIFERIVGEIKSGNTARIYRRCVEKELLERNGEYNLQGEFDLEQLLRAIDAALNRLREEELETGRRPKNEIAALNLLRKIIDTIIEELNKNI